MRALRQELLTRAGVTPLEVFGIGGPKLQAEGLKPIVDARELLAMGFTEILGKIPRALQALRALENSTREEKPDLIVVMDYPDFNLRLARRLKTLRVPMIYYIPPKLWVWRKGRIRELRELFERVLCIFPFEEEFYRREKLAQARYVGNPLFEELPAPLTREEARSQLGLQVAAHERVVTLMPGSRPAELKRHLPLFFGAVRKMTAAMASTQLKLLLPLPVTTDLAAIQKEVANDLPDVEVRVSQGDAHTCLLASDGAVVKSGTSTLEAALLGCPHVLVYQASAISNWIFRKIVRYSGPVGLANIVLGELKDDALPLVRELICDEATEEAIAEELNLILTSESRRNELAAGFARLKTQLEAGHTSGSASARAAREILSLVRDRTLDQIPDQTEGGIR